MQDCSYPEIWKDISGYEGLYQISNIGRVKSLDREEIVYCKNRTYSRKRTGRIMTPSVDKDGYLKIFLRKGDEKGKRFMIHRLVAIEFIPNLDNLPVVNHINEIKDDNRFDNLEWVTIRDNNIHNNRAIKASKKNSMSVIATDIETGEQHLFSSIAEARRLGYGDYHISDACTGKRKSCKGYYWKYA